MKKYKVCQTFTNGKGCYRIHGKYNNIFSAFWKFFKLHLILHPGGRTVYYVDKLEVECPKK
jgi:hypothetical protein